MGRRSLTDDQEWMIVERYRVKTADSRYVGTPTIAREFGVSDGTVRNILKRHGIDRRPIRIANSQPSKRRRFSPEQEQEIIKRYTTPLPDGTWRGAQSIAKEFDAHAPTIYDILERNGIATRDAKAAHSGGKQCKPIVNLPPEGESPPLCRCGCGQSVEWNRAKNCWRAFVVGHKNSGPYRDRDWLYEQYITLNRTGFEIAEACGVTPGVIYRFLRRFGIPARDHSMARVGRKPGALNPAWKGGVTPERQRLYKTLEWRSLVGTIFKRDGYHCQRCGTAKVQGVKLHAHHLTPWASDERLRFTPDNLTTLCDDCHAWVHSLENVDREFLR